MAHGQGVAAGVVDMLIKRIDGETLEAARRLSSEIASRLAHAQTSAFPDEAAAEAYLWELIGLLQEQAGVTARILTAAIDARNARRADEAS